MRLQVKKRQQRVTMILDSKSITYDLVDITEPGKEDEKIYMQTNSKTKDGSKNALPPQIFNDNVYCGVSSMMSDVCISHQTIALNISHAIGMSVYLNGYRQYKNNSINTIKIHGLVMYGQNSQLVSLLNIRW